METAIDLQPRTFNPHGVPAPPPSYNHVAVTPLLSSSRLITLAGLTGCDPASSDNPKTLPKQASIAYTKIQTCLAAAGATPRDIVQVGVVVSMDVFMHLPDHYPYMLIPSDHKGQALHCQRDG